MSYFTQVKWLYLQISHATESPLLSDREKYPTFLRMLITDMSHNAVRVALIRHFNWTRVAILYEDTERHSLVQLAEYSIPFLFYEIDLKAFCLISCYLTLVICSCSRPSATWLKFWKMKESTLRRQVASEVKKKLRRGLMTFT
jgi:hypothetical protein